MKTKRLVMLLFAALLVSGISFSQSASAYPGVAETPYTAISLQNDQFYSGYILYPNYADVDWFQWTNNTGSNVNISLFLWSPNYTNFDFVVRMFSPDGSSLPAYENEDGTIDSFGITNLLPGATVYWRVAGHNGTYSLSDQYTTWIHIN